MAFSNVHVIAFFVCLLGATRSSATNTLAACKIDAIYQFGDSISDTGNSVAEISDGNPFGSLPYGISINERTGRASDGLLMIDYIAQSAGLPLLHPYEKQVQGANLTHGASFAVCGATALDTAFLATMKIPTEYTNSSLNVQLGWFDTVLNSLCGKDKGKSSCGQKLKSALFVIGEFGINDYNNAFLERMSLEKTKKALVPNVVNVIINAAETLINRGAVRVVVPGIFPLGCLPSYLRSNFGAYDKYGCLKTRNEFTVYHNANLQNALIKLGKKYPTVRVVYGDLYNAFLYIMDNSSRLGFSQLTKACYRGRGGNVCANPKEYISFDGTHLTQQAYKYMAEWLISDIVPKLGCK